MATEATPSTPYPVRFSVNYPDRQLNGLSSFFRIIAIIPIWIIFSLISGANYGVSYGDNSRHLATYTSTAGWGVIAAIALLILFRQKYPRFIFDWRLP